MVLPHDPRQFPLAERFHKAEHLARELSEHMRQGFVPRLLDVRAASKVYDPAEVSDQAMLDKLNAIQASHEFTEQLTRQLLSYLESIREDTRSLLNLDTF
ncbi:MAG: hypothetical protein KDA85_21985 [Planctomycetaceae bacterium]|nr:hypothetical protein [Planctomycetaceae bacterium]